MRPIIYHAFVYRPTKKSQVERQEETVMATTRGHYGKPFLSCGSLANME
jgi:hypothetical protein